MNVKKNRHYSVLFLLLSEQQKVYMDISFAEDFGAILRKHWDGKVQCTRGFFSYEHPEAKPEMLVWKIGYVSREEANVFLKKWQETFVEEGFDIIVDIPKVDPKLMKQVQRYNSRFRGISFDNLIKGVDVRKVTCHEKIGAKKAAAQKYVAEAAENVLNIRTTWKVSNLFRAFCKEKGLTQSQALSLLVESANGGAPNELLEQDLQDRLCKANAVVLDKEEEIKKLRKRLQEEISSKKRPSQVQAAIIQDLLLKKFFDCLPNPLFSDAEEPIRRYGFRHIKELLPEVRKYHFPNKDGVYLIYLEYISYVKGKDKLLHIYGKTQEGERLKFSYPYARKNRYGKSLWDSEYLIQGYPWIFGVQKPKEIAYIIGALPIFDLNRISDWYVEEKFGEEFPCIPKCEDFSPEDGVTHKQLESVDERIRAAEDIKNFR